MSFLILLLCAMVFVLIVFRTNCHECGKKIWKNVKVCPYCHTAYRKNIWNTTFVDLMKGTGNWSSMKVEEMKKCPKCAESIRAEATKCRYCGSDVS